MTKAKKSQSQRRVAGNPKSVPRQINVEPLHVQSFDSVWDALGFAPAEAASLEIRSVLMNAIVAQLKSQKVRREKLSCVLALSHQRTDDFVRGRISKFSIDELVDLASYAGLEIDLTLKPKGT